MKEQVGKIEQRVLRTSIPCCGNRRTAIRAICSVPKEVYHRSCPDCGKKWVVTRTAMTESASYCVDRLEWEVSDEN